MLYEATIPVFFKVPLPKLPTEFPEKYLSLIQTQNCSFGNISESESEDCFQDKQIQQISEHILRLLQQQRVQFTRENKDDTSGHGTHGKNSSLRAKRQATPILAASSLLAGFLLRPAVSKFTGKLFGNEDEWIEQFNAVNYLEQLTF